MEKKQIITMRIWDYNPPFLRYTLPLLKWYAEKCRAEFRVIDKAVFNEKSITYEKFQVYEMAKGYDWTFFLDADALVHPDSADFTAAVTKDVVLFHGMDMSLTRFAPNDWTNRSQQVNGACTWCVLCSDWTRDIWHPMQETTFDDCLRNIHPTVAELKSGCCPPEHLIDDYIVTTNIARYGLNAKTMMEVSN